MTTLAKAFFLSILALVLTSPPSVQADLACHAGGVVATSQSGRAEVHEGAHGCRSFPLAKYTVVVGGVRGPEIDSLPSHRDIYVSDTGRTILLVGRTTRADQDSVTAYRDGRAFGTYTIAELLGDQASQVGDAIVRPSIEGVDLVITTLDGVEVTRSYLGELSFRR